MRILVTGGAGFIGSNFIHHMLKKHPDYEFVVLDKLTYAGRLENLRDVIKDIDFIRGDICNRVDVEKSIKDCNAILNFAAETHVDRSIIGAGSFMETNLRGTYVLLEALRKFDVEKFIQISTDEVYGSIGKGSFREDDPLKPNSPYSASKAGADMLVRSYNVTYSLPTIITRSSNNYGPYQYPEKIIPLFITNLILGMNVPLYGDGLNVRDWIHVDDNCRGIDAVLHNGKLGDIYNIASDCEKTNQELTHEILELTGKDERSIEYVPDRLGHDRRYSLDCKKIKALGWMPEIDLDTGLRGTITWYEESRWWWEPLRK
ncbi:MAG: dTDP-glucose 4,6-dehydratase [Candidatus Altiarchaeota archaeon]|nr:dTDP-glucose 4,6-dehydratase [Candidatus Altiarchaeota archaeon]